MTEKHFEVQYDGWRYFHIVDTINERVIARLDTKGDADAFLEMIKDYEGLNKENEELKQSKGAKIFNEIVYKNEIKALQKENEKLKKENEQLKRFITSMGFTIEKENGNITRATKEIRR